MAATGTDLPNPFLGAIQGIGANGSDPYAPPAGPTVAQQFSNALANIPRPHGVDLSQYAGSMNFHETPAMFAKGSSSSAPFNPTAAQNAVATSTPVSNGGFHPLQAIGHLWSDVKNAAVGDYQHAKGALEGAWHELTTPQGWQQGMSVNPFNAPFIQGAKNPKQADQWMSQERQSVNNWINNHQGSSVSKGPLSRFGTPVANSIALPPSLLKFGYGAASTMLTDPLTYTPGKVVEGGITLAKDAVQLAHLPQLAQFTKQAIKDSGAYHAVANSKVGQGVKQTSQAIKDGLGQLFVKYYGANPETKADLQARDALMGTHVTNIDNAMNTTMQKYKLTPQEWNNLQHAWEGTVKPMNNKVSSAINEFKNMLDKGPAGSLGEIGTNAELQTHLNGQPILQKVLDNYFPHLYDNSEAEVKQAIAGAPTKSFTTTGPFNQSRQFATLQDAMGAGLTPAHPAMAIRNRLVQSARAITNAQTINNLLKKGLIATEDAPNLVKSNVLNSLKWLEQRAPEEAGATTAAETIPNELAHQYKNTYTPEELKTLEQAFAQQHGDLASQLSAKAVQAMAKDMRDAQQQTMGQDVLARLRQLGGVTVNPGDKYFGEFNALPQGIRQSISANTGGFKLPKALAQSAPRYGNNTLKFASDLDKAAYVVRNGKNLSNSDAQFMQALRNHTGLSDQQIRQLGQQVHETIKSAVHPQAGVELKVPKVLQLAGKNPTARVSLDDAANQLGTNASDLLNKLGNAQTGKLRVNDFIDQAKQAMQYDQKQQNLAQLTDHLSAVQSAQKLHDLAAAEQAMFESAPSLADSANFDNLLGTMGADNSSSMPASLMKYFAQPNDERAFRQALQETKDTNPLLNLYDKGQGLWKSLTLYNPMVHGHNIAVNGMYLGGASPKAALDAFKQIRSNPESSDMYQRALRAGAISADNGSSKNAFESAIKKATPATTPLRQQFKNAMSGADYLRHGVLWDADKGIRTALFQKGLEQGMNDQEAAKMVNKYMVDYNGGTPFEQQFMSRIFPFYRWTKGNMGTQLSALVNQPRKVALYEAGKNAVSQGLSGNDAKNGKIDLGVQLPGGNKLMMDPYSPIDDPLKLLRDGPGAFVFGKANPLVKDVVNEVANQNYYPTASLAPSGKAGMANSPIRLPGAPASYNVAETEANLAKNLIPFAGNAVAGAITRGAGIPDTSTKPKLPIGDQALQAAIRLGGAFPSTDNPAMDNYYNEKQQQADLQNFMKYLYKMGQKPSKEMTKQAYAKIPFPATGN